VPLRRNGKGARLKGEAAATEATAKRAGHSAPFLRPRFQHLTPKYEKFLDPWAALAGAVVDWDIEERFLDD
jgi:hypothetical protein